MSDLARLAPGPDDAQALLREHPWPADLDEPGRLEWLWTFDVAAPRARLWPLVSDMSRLNRALGNPEMTFEERAGQRHGRGRYGGVMHEWHERPWEWESGRWYRLVRHYHRGAMKALFSVHTLSDLPDGGTRLQVYFGVVPRWRWIRPGLRVSFGAIGRAYRRVIPALAAELDAARTPAVFALTPPPLGAQAEQRLRTIEASLADTPVEPGRGRRPADYAPRRRARPCASSARWSGVGRSTRTPLRACLHATRAGMFELAWDVVCPHCRGVRSEPHLRSSRPAAEPCDVTFGTADAIEVSFRIHPGGADAAVVLQRGAGAQAAHPSRSGCWRRAPRSRCRSSVDRALPPAPARRRRARRRPRRRLRRAPTVAQASVAWTVSALPGERAVTAIATLTLHNDLGPRADLHHRGRPPHRPALRPGRLLSHPDFRDLFSDEYLAADVGLAVGEQTILFTDIVGSTAMYAAHGDPGAFVAVRAHLTKAFAIVARHRGGVIKTIGDAVMAAFTDPVDALAAAEELQRTFAGDDEPLRLRISLGTGPCIAVRLNANLDYFGHTVNLAAKLQAAAEAGQVALSEATMAAPGVADALEARGVTAVAVEVPVKGLAQPVTAWRWDVW
ncbi:MAG: adenylate/guanylate cyclase domain-containing protein [Kofleriaceae bacterium]